MNFCLNGRITIDIQLRSFRVNLISHFHTIREFLPGMLEENRGTIVTVASVLGYLGCAKLCRLIRRIMVDISAHASQ